MARNRVPREWVFNTAKKRGYEQLSFFYDAETKLRVAVQAPVRSANGSLSLSKSERITSGYGSEL